MRKLKRMGLLIILALAMIAAMTYGFRGNVENSAGNVASRVSSLVDQLTVSPLVQQQALADLENLGDEAVPYIVASLGDGRPLAAREMRTLNKFPGAMEKYAFRTPAQVHDAMSILLTQMTGEFAIFDDDSSNQSDRKRNTSLWVDWCSSRYPAKVVVCKGGLQDRK